METQRVSDSDVESNVERALSSMQGVDPDQVDVNSDNEEVTLTGQVDSRDTRDRIGQIVSVVKGVERVDNRLEIKETSPAGTGAGPTAQPSGQPQARREPGQQPTAQMEENVRSALKRSEALHDEDDINVRTQNGTVILSGKVPNQASKELAERIAREQKGVTSVQNNLQVRRD